MKRKGGCLWKDRSSGERDARENKSKVNQKSLQSFGALVVTKSLHCFTGLWPVLAEGKTIHTPTQPLSQLGKAGRGCVCIISTTDPANLGT